MTRRTSSLPTKKTYKTLPKHEREELVHDLFYEVTQNLKMPFMHFIKRQKQIVAGLSTFFLVYLFKYDGEVMPFISDATIYYFGVQFLMYKFSNLKREDIL